MLVTITDFAQERHEDRDTINAYIRNHQEIKKFVHRQGKNVVIDTDSEGFRALEKQYPLPQLVQVIEDTESRQKLIKAQELIIQLQGQLTEASKQIAQAESMKLLLEDKEDQLAKTEERLKKEEDRSAQAEADLKSERERTVALQDELKAERERTVELQKELQSEKSKTWLQKLLRK